MSQCGESRGDPLTSLVLRRRLFYGWVVVAATIPVVLVTAGVRSAPGAWLLSMEADTGWSKGTLSFATALGLVLFGLGGPLAGWLMSRLGVMAVTAASVVISAGSMLLTAFVDSVWQLAVVFGVLSGVGTGLVASVLGATVANRWFVAHRGLVVGIFGAATSAGQLVFFPLLTRLASDLGWRGAALVLAGIVAVALPGVLAFVREHPQQLGLQPLGAAAPMPPPSRQSLRSVFDLLASSVRTLDFWLLAGTFMVCGATSNGLVGQHFIAHAVDHGFTETVAASWLAVMGMFNFVGTIGSGWLTDRVDPRRLLLTYYGLRGVSLFMLPAIHDTLGIGAFAILFGLDYIATVPPTVALAADRFGRDNVGIVYGWVFAAHQLGAAGAAWIAGVLRDELGDYAAPFLAAGALAVVAGVAALSINRPRPAVA